MKAILHCIDVVLKTNMLSVSASGHVNVVRYQKETNSIGCVACTLPETPLCFSSRQSFLACTLPWMSEMEDHIAALKIDIQCKDGAIEASGYSGKSAGYSKADDDGGAAGGYVKKQGQHGGWMPKCAKLARAFNHQEWKTCSYLIKEFKTGSSTFAGLCK